MEIDFFDSPLQARVRELLEQVGSPPSAGAAARVNPKEYKNRVWVTRPRPGVDRCASAWLIRGFIDPKGRFAFAPEDRVPAGAVPYDMFHEGGFGHRGGDCNFETLEILKGWARQGLADEKLLERGMDLVEGLYHSPAK